ncbi:MAG: hypothetical protein EPO08_17395 [Rhodospirillaceae bacterium]|nr:MAG: hypothetical protein EPO08_17395 [Rhodospirillaceae bacterium]
MGRIKVVLPSLVAIVGLFGCATENPAIRALEAEVPEATWDQKTAVKADVTCDGANDTLVLGSEKDTVWIGVVPGPGKTSAKLKPLAWNFPISAGNQGSFCARPVRIVPYDHVCENDAYGKMGDCKPIKGCKDFAVVDDTCDSFNFYWNTDGKFSLWRE